MVQYDTYFPIIVCFYAIKHLAVLDIETQNPLSSTSLSESQIQSLDQSELLQHLSF